MKILKNIGRKRKLINSLREVIHAQQKDISALRFVKKFTDTTPSDISLTLFGQIKDLKHMNSDLKKQNEELLEYKLRFYRLINELKVK